MAALDGEVEGLKVLLTVALLRGEADTVAVMVVEPLAAELADTVPVGVPVEQGEGVEEAVREGREEVDTEAE